MENKVINLGNALNQLKENGSLTPNFIGTMFESCVVCLTSQNHSSGKTLESYRDTKNLYKGSYNFIWDLEIDETLNNTYRDEKRTTDWGAMFLSLFLVIELTEYTEVCTSDVGTGIDFWLNNGDDKNFLQARLEISGIRKSNESNNIKRRLKIKEKQTKKSDNYGFPAYISIIEFNIPEAVLIKR